jgi:hypothetical protein
LKIKKFKKKKYISNFLLDLVYDKIINVRISRVKCIKILNKNKYDYLKNNETITKFVSILKKDRLEVSQIIDKFDIENINVSKMKKEKKIIC